MEDQPPAPTGPSLLSGGDVTVMGDGSEPIYETSRTSLERGAALGRYVILGELGTGGMGVVYEAYDPELDRRLAIKLLHPRRRLRGEKKVEEDHTRLLREAQAMARLSHPNVITVHDVGMFEDRVFVAMELVEGGTLNEWIARENPSWEAILRALVGAGRGLAAAHRAGLIHRDFKPDNVLVTGDGRVVVMDFGLARAADESDDEVLTPGPDLADLELDSMSGRTGVLTGRSAALSTNLTRVGAVMGTPAYMAPEQHVGQGADARSDQFAFCVSAFELLHGVRPFTGENQASLALQAAEGDFKAPADSKIPSWVQRIIERGLAPRATERWPSMDDLVQALDRDPAARRRRIAWGVAGLLVVGAAAAAVTLSARQEASICAGAADQLAGVWDEDRRERMRTAFLATGRGYAASTFDTVAAGLDDYAQRWATAHTASCEATHLRGDQSTELLDRSMACLERRKGSLGTVVDSFTKADEEVLREAVNMLDTLRPLAPCEDRAALLAAVLPPEDAATAGEVEAIRGLIDEARTLDAAGKTDAGLELSAEADRRARETGYAPAEAEARLTHGELLAGAGKYTDAEVAVREAIVLAEVAQDDPVRANAWLELAWIVGVRQADAREGAQLLDLAEGTVRRLGPGQERREAKLAQTRGAILRRLGKLDDAIASYRHAIELLERVHGPDHTQVATALTNLGTLLSNDGQFEESMAMHERAMKIIDGKLGPEHPSRANVIHNMGMTLKESGKREEALDRDREALLLRQKSLGEEHPITASSHNDLGLLLENMGRYDEAAEHLQRSLEIKEKVLGPDHSNVGNTLVNLGLVYQARGEHEKALAGYERALEIKRKLLGDEHAIIGSILQNIGIVYADQERYDLARDHYERALAVKEKALGKDDPSVANTLHNLGDLHQELGDLERALELYSRALQIKETRLGAGHPRLASTLTSIGTVYLERKKWALAREPLERALAIRESNETGDAELAKTRFATARALWQIGKDRERARTLARQARDGYARAGEQSAEEHARVAAWLRKH